MRHDKPPTSPFEVGDRVRIKCPGSKWHGEETTVISPLIHARLLMSCCGRAVWVDGWTHQVDIRPDAESLAAGADSIGFRPHELIPIGNIERGSWDQIERDVGWNPTKQVA